MHKKVIWLTRTDPSGIVRWVYLEQLHSSRVRIIAYLGIDAHIDRTYNTFDANRMFRRFIGLGYLKPEAGHMMTLEQLKGMIHVRPASVDNVSKTKTPDTSTT